MCLPNNLFPVFMFAFIFHCPSFSCCWPLAFLIVSPPLWIFMFFFPQNSSLLFSIACSSSFSVNHVSVNVKNNVEKDTTLLFFLFFLKPGRPCDFFPNKTLSCISDFELFYIGMPVVRTDSRAAGRSVGVRSRDHQIFWKGSLPHFLTRGAPLRVLRVRELYYN